MMIMRDRALRRFVAAAVLVAAGLAPAAAFAGGNEAAAEALFVEAKKLAAQKKYAEACPKFAESNRLDRGAGTLIHLGDCYEKNKQTASAWATYKEAASAAQALGRKDWEKLASHRATILEAKLAHLTIRVDPSNDKEGVKKTEVSRDGAEVTAASWGLPIPVDVGEHHVEASAPDKKSFKTTVKIARDGESAEVTIPKLESMQPEPSASAPPAAPPPSTPAAAPRPRDDGSGQRTVGLIVGGVGAAGLAAGAITGFMAIGKSNDAKAICATDGPCASREAVDAADNAKTMGLISTVGFIAGGALLATGAVLYVTAPSAEPLRGSAGSRTALRVAPSVGPTGGGVILGGRF